MGVLSEGGLLYYTSGAESKLLFFFFTKQPGFPSDIVSETREILFQVHCPHFHAEINDDGHCVSRDIYTHGRIQGNVRR